MELFDKRFVYCMWDDVLEGKEVFVAGTITTLEEAVNGDCAPLRTAVIYSDNEDAQFESVSHGTEWLYAYYDPNYDIKAAQAHGKRIQVRIPGTNDWHDSISPHWENTMEYRVKPEVSSNPQEWLGKTVTVAGFTGIVTGYNPNADRYFVAGTWCAEEELKLCGY